MSRGVRLLLTSLVLSLFVGCRPANHPESLTIPMDPRTIPIRIVQVVGACQRCNPALACSASDVCSSAACSADPVKPENVDARIREANEDFAGANLSFTLASLEKYAMPDLMDYHSTTPLPWARVRFQIRQALPNIPCNAWPDNAALTPREWVVQASTIFSPVESIPIWVTPVSMGGYGIYPWRARAFLIDSNQINHYRDTNLAHEIGHFLGLPHAFESTRAFHQESYNLERGTIRTPLVKGYLGHRDFWEFVYRPGSPNRFFQSRSDPRPEDEPFLRTIEAWDVSPEEPSNCKLDAKTCVYSCLIGGEWISTGDPRLGGLSFVVPSPDGSAPRLGINIMDYRQSPVCTANGLVASQIQQVRRVLAVDLPLDDQRTYPHMSGLRPRLGVYSGPAPTAWVDVDHNYEERPQSPVYLTQHPSWAEDELDLRSALAEH